MKDISDKLAQAQEHLSGKRAAQARSVLMRALPNAGGPQLAIANRLLSQAAFAEKQVDQAIYYAERAVETGPSDPEGLVQLASLHWALGRSDAAIEAARRAVAQFPTSRNAHATLLNFYLRDERFADVLAGCEAAMKLFPQDSQFSTTRATMLLSLGKPEKAVEFLREAAKRDPKNLRVFGALAPALNYLPGVDPAEIVAVHRAYGDLLAQMLPPRAPGKGSGPLDPQRPLKIGFISPDLRGHPMRFFIAPVFEHLDRSQFSLTCYFTGGVEDEESARLKQLVSTWKHLPTLNIGQLADVIARDGIDILIDLAGHTRFERLGTMHLKPAPLQMNYIGYPATTGIRATDYHITDTLSSPPGQESAWTEKLLRVDPVFFAYQPMNDPPPVATPPHVASGHITFGSFNTLMKLNDSVVRAWTKVVMAVPGSRLVVKNVQLMQEEARRVPRERFVAAGLPEDRLEILGHTGTARDHLATYSRVDIGLDTFPYAGMTTTLESILMGVPVVSLIQNTHASRVGLCILKHVNLGDLAVDTEEDFINVAKRLAADRARLASLRTSLRETLMGSILCDGPGFGARLGDALRRAWRDHCGAGVR